MTDTVPVLLLTGPVGVGKTTVAGELSALLNGAAIPHAVVDCDALRGCYPAPPSDPFHTALGLRNLAAVWANYRAAGAARLVLVDVIEANDDLPRYAAAVPSAAMVVVRLAASPRTLAARVRRREQGSGREWHIQRSAELTAIMERNGIGDLVIDTDAKPVAALAREIAARTGWLPPPDA